jgi:serine/threonine protein kinase
MTGELVGRTLGDRYRFEALLGEGTFAQVYRVYDERRRSPLAAKVLRRGVTSEHAFFKRFQREAAILTRLQHPHIVRCYGIVEAEEQIFILMDLIPGQTLQTALANNKPLIPRAALAYLAPLVAALHYAHSDGIIHRDLKPANVLIHNNGTLYITDFGIARILSDTSTLTMGMALGTPLYMAPEQIMGQPVTAAADIYALGVMIYEILAGQTPFRGVSTGTRGSSTSERIAFEHVHIMPEPPTHLNPHLTSELQNVMLRALDKRPDRRFHSAPELYDALAQAIGSSAQSADRTDPAVAMDLRLPEWSQFMTPVPEPAPKNDQPAPASSATSVTQAHLDQVTALPAAERVPAPSARPVYRDYAPPPQSYAPAPSRAAPRRVKTRFSPLVLLFVAGALLIAGAACWVSWYLLTGSDGAEPTRRPYTSVPAASGDDATGGTPPVTAVAGASADVMEEWGSSRVAFDSRRGGTLDIYTMRLDGSDLQAITSGTGDERGPSWSPDGTQIAFYGADADQSNFDIFVVSANGTNLRNLTASPDIDERYPTWSPDGAQIAFHSNADSDFDIYTIDVASGQQRALTFNTAQDLGPDWSPSGRYIAYHTDQWSSTYQIAVVDVNSLEVHQLTRAEDDINSFPTWSPNGNEIAYNTIRDNAVNIIIMQADGTGVRALTSSAERESFPDWSPDGRYILYQHGPESASSLRVMPAEGGDWVSITGSNANFLPDWSPASG